MLLVLLENRFNHRWLDYYEALPGQIPTSDMAQKVATERKKEIATRDNLPRPNCDSDGKAENKRQRTVVWLIYHRKK